jgi:DNA-binding Lrp family transcriptional regulator
MAPPDEFAVGQILDGSSVGSKEQSDEMMKVFQQYDDLFHRIDEEGTVGEPLLTDRDRQLLALLKDNARLSTTELARRLGVSRSTVQSRLERLERSGVIAGYTVRLSEDAVRNQVRAYVLIEVAPKRAQVVVRQLRRRPEVERLESVSGTVDLVAEVRAASVADLDTTIDEIGVIDGVDRTTSLIVLSTRFAR